MKNHLFDKRCTFSIRKFAIGACSVMIGASLLGAQIVGADEVTPVSQPEVSTEAAPTNPSTTSPAEIAALLANQAVDPGRETSETIPAAHQGNIVNPEASVTSVTNSSSEAVSGNSADSAVPSASSQNQPQVSPAVSPEIHAVTPVRDERLTGTIVDNNRQHRQTDYAAIVAQDKTQAELTAWKNDQATSEISLASKDQALQNLRVTVSNFVSGNNIITAEQIKAVFLKSAQAYTGMPGYGSTSRQIPQGSRQESNDILYTDQPVNLAANQLQNIWLTIKVPKEAAAGLYAGQISVTADGLAAPLTFNYRLRVQDMTLPDSTDFKNTFDIELWQNPFAVAEYYNVTPFSEEHFRILRPHMEKYKELGGHAVTTTIVEEPWAGQTYSKNATKFPSMIKWTKKSNGQFSFDYTNFDKWVEFNKSLGLGDKIVAYSVAPWTNKVRYFDEASNSTKELGVTPGSAGQREAWTAFLSDFMTHMESKGWKEQTYIGIDERGFDGRTFDLIDSIRGIDAKPFKTAGAMDGFVTKKDLAMRVIDLNVGSTAVKEHPQEFEALRQAREKLGLRTTMYTATGHIPGNFSLNDPGESYWTMLYAASIKAEGFLRWAYDSWVADPLRDTTHNAFEAGDPFLIFPDERDAANPISKSSTRLEKMAEGIRDINKLMAIKKEVPAFEQKVQDLLGTIKPVYAHSQYYLTEEGKQALASDMASFKQALNQLTEEALAYKQTARREVESLSLSQTGTLEILVDTPTSVTAILNPANLLDNRVTWTSSNPAVASVSKGQITGHRVGKARITATSIQDPTKTTSLVVDVKRPSIEESAQVAYYSFGGTTEEAGQNIWGENSISLSQEQLGDGFVQLSASQGIALPANTSLNHDWSVGFWLRREGGSGRLSVLSSADKARSLDVSLSSNNSNAGVHVNASAGGILTYRHNLPANEWHHVMWTNDAHKGLSYYVDGKLIQTNTWTVNNNFLAPIELLGGNGFIGKLAELKIYNRALTAAEVKTSSLLGGLQVGETEVTTYVGEPYTLDAEFQGEATDTSLTYTSSNPEVATVDEFGLVTSHKQGETIIRISHAESQESQEIRLTAAKRLNHHYSIPQYRLPAENLSDIERAPGTDRQYLGQPDMIMLDDNQTLITAYPKGHGAGPIIMKISRDGGRTWTEKTDLPRSWATSSYETPTLYKLNMTNGSQKLMMITGRPKWHGNTTGGFQTSLSTDNGDHWTEYKNNQPTLPNGQPNYSVVAMASLVQLKDAQGNLIDKWMGVFHDLNYNNYKTYLTFDEQGNDVWSQPERYLSQYDQIEKAYQICEVGMFRSPDGHRIVALGRSQSHNHHSVMFYSDDEGQTWSKPQEMQGALQGERHKAVYDPISGRLLITFREITLDQNNNGRIENGDWSAGEWVAWVGTYEDLMQQNEGQYRILLAEDWAKSAKSGDTGYAGLVVKPDGTFLLDSYGHWDKNFSNTWTGGVTTDLSYIKLATFKLGQIDQALGRVDKSGVEALLTELAAQDFTRYTEDSVARLQEPLTDLAVLAEDKTAQQIQLDQAIAAVRSQIQGLVERSQGTHQTGTTAEGQAPTLTLEKPRVEAVMASVKHRVIEQENAHLEVGQRRVKQPGRDGLLMNFVEISSKGRKIVDSYVATTEIPEIVEIGTKPAKVRSKTEEHHVMYNIIERVNPELEVGKRRTVQRGVRGMRRDVVEISQGQRRVISSEIYQQPVDRIVEIGGKQPAAKVRHKDEEHQVMYRIVERVNPDLPAGTRRTIQRGVRGRRVDHLEITGSERRVVSSEILVQPVDKIVEVGAPLASQPVAPANPSGTVQPATPGASTPEAETPAPSNPGQPVTPARSEEE